MLIYRFPKTLYDEAKQSVTVTDGFFYVPAPHLLRIDDDGGPVVKIHTTAGSFFSALTGEELMDLIAPDYISMALSDG